MIRILPSSDSLLAVELGGVVTRNDILLIEGEMTKRLATGKVFGIAVDLTLMQDMTANAIAEDLRYELGLIGKMRQFPRVAIVTDKQWISGALRLLDPLLWLVEVRSFKPGRMKDAMAWAADLPQEKAAPEPGIRRIETHEPDLLAFEIVGRMHVDDIDRIAPILQKAYDEHGKIDLFLRMTEFDGFDVEILAQRATFSMKLAAMGHVRRYAVVGAKDWMEGVVSLFKPLIPIDLRTFAPDHEAEAWEWLAASRPVA